MGYPFYDNPIDDYFYKLFDLKLREFEASCITLDKEATPEARTTAAQTGLALNEEIRTLKLEYDLPERTFDRYKSPAELAVERFERERPEPPRRDIYDCKHTKTQATKRVFRNGALHVVLQCKECGAQPRSLSKSEHNVDALPEFDDGLYLRVTAEQTLWEDARREVYEAEMRRGNDIPDYDREAFEAKYRELNPPPCLEGCDHKLTEPRLRTYPGGGSAVVLQCVRCGHHTGASSKSKHPSWVSLPLFDSALIKRSKDEYMAWHKRLSEAWKSDYQTYKTSVQQKLQSGELSWQDNSRFGTYYDSPEWERTRARILYRDDYQCQACKRAAECVHHILYDRLGAENDFDLISLCHSCHALVHQEQRKAHNLYRMSPSLIRSMHEPDDYDEDDEDDEDDEAANEFE